MFCPRCGNHQASGEVLYCSSCGFAHGGAQRLLSEVGEAPSNEAIRDANTLSPRQHGIRQGTLLLFIGAVVVPLLAALDSPGELIGSAAIIFFIGGLVRMLYAAMFLEKIGARSLTYGAAALTPRADAAAKAASRTTPRAASLPASSATIFDAHVRRDTAELAQPPSVTDHTTRLLEIGSQETEVRKQKSE